MNFDFSITILTHWFQVAFFKPFFHFFSLKERVPLNQFFWRDHLNDRWAFFYQLMLISRSLSKGLIFRTQKSEGRFDPKKIFFSTFKCWDHFKVFFKAKKKFLKNFFWKKIWKTFFEKIFLEIFSKFYFRVGQSVHKCNVVLWECDLLFDFIISFVLRITFRKITIFAKKMRTIIYKILKPAHMIKKWKKCRL